MSLKLYRVGDEDKITYKGVDYLVRLIFLSERKRIYVVSEPSHNWEVSLVDGGVKKINPLITGEILHHGIISCIKWANRVYRKIPSRVLEGRSYRMLAEFDLFTHETSGIKFIISLQSVVPSMKLELTVNYVFEEFILCEVSLEVLNSNSILRLDSKIDFHLPEYPLPEVSTQDGSKWIGYRKTFYRGATEPDNSLTSKTLRREEGFWAVVAVTAQNYINEIRNLHGLK